MWKWGRNCSQANTYCIDMFHYSFAPFFFSLSLSLSLFKCGGERLFKEATRENVGWPDLVANVQIFLGSVCLFYQYSCDRGTWFASKFTWSGRSRAGSLFFFQRREGEKKKKKEKKMSRDVMCTSAIHAGLAHDVTGLVQCTTAF